MKKRFLLLFFLLVQLVQAQLYPVQLSTVLVPPYLSTISTYSSTMNEKFMLQLYVNDLTLSRRQVFLKLYIEGNGIQARSTPFVEGAAPLFVSGGESVQLSQMDLAPYFKIQNLEGISPAQYSRPLPQGMYSFCVEVYDFYSRERIAQKTCAMGYFMVNNPPLLNLPPNHESLDAKSFQSIFFNWTARHINVGNVEYEFTLVELLDSRMPSGNGFFVSKPLYKTTTSSPSLLYGPGEPLLISGRKYAWRVQVKTLAGLGDSASFENDGYSEIYDFTFKGDCDKPQFVLAEPLGTTEVKVSWQQNPNHSRYLLQCRKIGTTDWFDDEGTKTEAQIGDLEAGQSYEFRVGAYCTDNVISYSPIGEFKMPEKKSKDFQCGLKPSIDLSKQTLYTGSLNKGQEFMAGDFSVHVLEASGQGTLTGKGWIKVPYIGIMRIAVTFSNIQLNTDLKLVSGEVKTTYDPQWSNILDVNKVVDVVDDVVDKITGNEDVHDEVVNYTIGDVSNIKVEDGKIKITNPATGAVATVLDHDKGEVTTIKDKEGNVYNVSRDGKVTKEAEGAGQSTAQNTQGLDDKGQATQLANAGYKVVFAPIQTAINGRKTRGATDQKPENATGELEKLYKTISNAEGDSYTYLYQAVSEQAKTDYVLATLIELGAKDKKKAKVQFKTNASTLVKIVDSTTVAGNKAYVLELKAFNSAGRNEIVALLKGTKPSDKDQVIGAMMEVDIKEDEAQKVVLIPVNGAAIPQDIEAQLNKIYQGTGGSFKISVASNYTPQGISTLSCGESGWFANYTDDQNAFIGAYQATHSFLDKQRYVFILKDIQPSRNLSGFMPQGRQVGFLFSNTTTAEESKAGNLASTLAHELGHGVYELQHPWESHKITQGSTNWLMDYAQGTQIPYIHWEQISHPKFIVPFLKSDASGALAGGGQSGCTMPKVVRGCPDGTLENPLNDGNWKTITILLNQLKTALTNKTAYTYKKDLTLDTGSQISIGKTCYDPIYFDFSWMKENSKKVSTLGYTKEITKSFNGGDYWTLNFDGLLWIKIPQKDKDGKNTKGKIDYLEEWLNCGGGAATKTTEAPAKPATVNITATQLLEVFPNTDKKRLAEVAATINKYSDKFEINTPLRMSHFLAQTGYETDGLRKLEEDICYKETAIRVNFGKSFYCDLFEGYESDLNACGNNHPAPCVPELKKYSTDLKIKSKYICSASLFDYVYSCRMDNGNPMTKDGSKFFGKGFIHLTGKENYENISKEWNKLYPDDKKEFHGKDILLLTTDIEIAMKASMIFWKYKELNAIADKNNFDKVTEVVNGGDNGKDKRKEYTEKLKKTIK